MLPVEQESRPFRIDPTENKDILRGYGAYETESGLVFAKWGPTPVIVPDATLASYLLGTQERHGLLIPDLLGLHKIDDPDHPKHSVAQFVYINPQHQADSKEEYASTLINMIGALRNVDVKNIRWMGYEVRNETHYARRVHSILNDLNGLEAIPLGINHKIFEKVSAFFADIDWQNVSFVHSDFAPNNFIVKGKTGWLFDFEHSALGQHTEDWGRLTMFYRVFDPEIYRRLMENCPGLQAVFGFQAIQALFLARLYLRKHQQNPQDLHARITAPFWLQAGLRIAEGREPFDENERRMFIELDEQHVSGRARQERALYLPQFVLYPGK